MGEGIKIVVTGNCQARPLASLLANIPNVQITEIIILHQSSESQAPLHEEVLLAADIVLAQYTDDAFSPIHLRSKKIQACGKALIWPNIFFSGQQPFLKYVTSPTKGRLRGPLDVYHDLRIMELWHLDRLGTPFFSDIFDDRYTEEVAAKSLHELERREKNCDVSVAEKIATEWRNKRLFFTFNHPSIFLLQYLATQITERIGLPHPFPDGMRREPLDKIIPPSIFYSRHDDRAIYQGVSKEDGSTKLSYSWDALVEASFNAYDKQKDLITGGDFRYTPSYP